MKGCNEESKKYSLLVLSPLSYEENKSFYQMVINKWV